MGIALSLLKATQKEQETKAVFIITCYIFLHQAIE